LKNTDFLTAVLSIKEKAGLLSTAVVGISRNPFLKITWVFAEDVAVLIVLVEEASTAKRQIASVLFAKGLVISVIIKIPYSGLGFLSISSLTASVGDLLPSVTAKTCSQIGSSISLS